tara:strand:- start:223 stop:561 length:339 start_codon:yes stop_codon:yes gene_type:complete
MAQNRQSRITQTLTNALSPEVIHVLNESNQHHVPKDSETHFNVTIVCQQFETQSLVQRHRIINTLLQCEFDADLHALAIHAYTPDAWHKRQQQSPASPNCLDGFKHAKEDRL